MNESMRLVINSFIKNRMLKALTFFPFLIQLDISEAIIYKLMKLFALLIGVGALATNCITVHKNHDFELFGHGEDTTSSSTSAQEIREKKWKK